MVFSVIMPVYNKAPYLARAVESALSQEHLAELIAIDDGSTDGSGELLDTLAKRDSRLVVVHQKNAGVSATRNRGLSLATGDYICFLDGDDLLDHGFFGKAYGVIEDSLPDITFFAYRKLRDNGVCVDIPSPTRGTVTAADALKSCYFHQIETGYLGCASNKLVKASLAKSCLFDTSLRLAEDLDYWVKVLDKAEVCTFSELYAFTYVQSVAGSSCFDKVDYPSQLRVRVGYKKLLEKKVSGFFAEDLLREISRFVYYSAADACLISKAEGKAVVRSLFAGDADRKKLYTKGLGVFQKTVVWLIKHGIYSAAVALIRAKQRFRGQRNV